MKRFLAVVGLVAFIAACSDSNTTAPPLRVASAWPRIRPVTRRRRRSAAPMVRDFWTSDSAISRRPASARGPVQPRFLPEL